MNYVDGPNVMGNGRPTIPPQSAPKNAIAKSKKAPECPSLDNRNWLIHQHYSRREFVICKVLIQEELKKSNGKCEYANYIQGILLRHEGKIQESLGFFQICHVLNPRNVDNIKQVARSLYLLGKHRLSLEAYLQADHCSEDSCWDIYYDTGMCLIHLGEDKRAKEYLNKSISLSRQECTYVALAKISLKEDDIAGAIKIYLDALESYPDSSDILTSLGIVYMKTGDYQRAFEKLGSALVHDPTCTKALLSAGSMMQAISCLKRANYLSPFDWKTLYNLGLVHITTQQYASAFNFLSAAINLRSDSGATFMLLAVALRHLGDNDNARHAYEQAAMLSPDDGSVPLNYALFLEAVGEVDDAAKELRRFQEIAEIDSARLNQEMLETANKLSLRLSDRVANKNINSMSKLNITGKQEDVLVQENASTSKPIASSPPEEPIHTMAPDEV